MRLLILITLTFFSSLTYGVELFNISKTYSTPTEVRYSEYVEGKYVTAHFKNKWYIKGEKPTFYPNGGAWEKITKTVSTSFNPELDEAKGELYIVEWNSKGKYPGGSLTKYNESCYKAKWWTINQPSNTPWEIISCPTITEVILPSLNNTPVDTNNSSECGDGENISVWDREGVYLAGNMVYFVDNGDVNRTYYKAKWWTSGDKPIKNPNQPWDTPWKSLGSDCPPLITGDVAQTTVSAEESSNGIPNSYNINPAVVTDQDNNISLEQATNNAAQITQETYSPVVPPVIVNAIPVSNPISETVPTTLPKDGYEFLHLLSNEDWDWLFPLRSGKYVSTTPCLEGQYLNCGGSTRNQPPSALEDGSKDTFTLDAFKRAVLVYNTWASANNYKQFLNEGSLKQQAEEFIAFWAKSSRETSGSWSSAKEPWIVETRINGESIIAWKGGLYWIEEIGYSSNADGISSAIAYVDSASSYVPEVGRSYYGRGVIQLSWNYNYGAFSEWLYNNAMMKEVISTKRMLLVKPNLVAQNGQLSILSGIWFWMTPQGAKPSSHDVLYGDITHISASTQDRGLPQTNDGTTLSVEKGSTMDESVFAYRLGTIINIVNGAIECNGASKWHSGPVERVLYYDAYAAYFNDKYSVEATRIQDAKASSRDIWIKHISDDSSENIKTATCYNLKSYYGW